MFEIIFQGVKNAFDTMKSIPVTDKISLFHFCVALLFLTIIVKIIPIVTLAGFNTLPRASRAEARGDKNNNNS